MKQKPVFPVHHKWACKLSACFSECRCAIWSDNANGPPQIGESESHRFRHKTQAAATRSVRLILCLTTFVLFHFAAVNPINRLAHLQISRQRWHNTPAMFGLPAPAAVRSQTPRRPAFILLPVFLQPMLMICRNFINAVGLAP